MFKVNFSMKKVLFLDTFWSYDAAHDLLMKSPSFIPAHLMQQNFMYFMYFVWFMCFANLCDTP
jgi:hypothetical protein